MVLLAERLEAVTQLRASLFAASISKWAKVSPRTQVTRGSEFDVDRQGVDHFIGGISAYAMKTLRGEDSVDRFVLQIADQYAYIRLTNLWHPVRFLRDMAGVPPISFGTVGFRRDMVDDANPARHYVAFLFVGYWLPTLPAIVALWVWEIAGFVRYGGNWSWPDLASGRVAIHHGRLVRRYGAVILPGLIAAELAESAERPE